MLTSSEQQAARDSMIAIGSFINEPDNAPPPSKEDALPTVQKIEALQGQLILVDSYMQALDNLYKQFLAAHPN
jgi:hypothetical protein